MTDTSSITIMPEEDEPEIMLPPIPTISETEKSKNYRVYIAW